jgi:zinc finger SWIM domain-containing protein 3
VITFHTTYSTNKEYRPFGVFVGFNHFRERVVFGAALLYDEIVDSFKWLFETFLAFTKSKASQNNFYRSQCSNGKGSWQGVYGYNTWFMLLAYGLECSTELANSAIVVQA